MEKYVRNTFQVPFFVPNLKDELDLYPEVTYTTGGIT